MNNTISITVGIDSVIQSIQTLLYTKLSVEWNPEIDFYGRIYRNVNLDGQMFPAWYYGNNEYKDVMYNDAFACCSMFIDDEIHKTDDEMVFTTNVKCVFMVDLSRILPSNTERADAKAQKDVIELLRNHSFNRYKVKGIEKGIKNVFRGFKTDNLKFVDEQPYHCFAVNLELEYYIEDSCN